MLSWLKSVMSRADPYPAAPPGRVLYAVGDIHGRSDCLARAQALIDRDVCGSAATSRRPRFIWATMSIAVPTRRA